MLLRPSLKIWLWGMVTGAVIACGTMAAADKVGIRALPASVETAAATMPRVWMQCAPVEGTEL